MARYNLQIFRPPPFKHLPRTKNCLPVVKKAFLMHLYGNKAQKPHFHSKNRPAMLRRHLPNFLKQLDRRLLLHRPYLWELQLHSYGFWMLTLIALSIAVPLLIPVSAGWLSGNMSGLYAPLFGIPALGVLALWAYSQYQHQGETQFAQLPASAARLRFWGYSAVALLALLPPTLPFAITDYRLASLVDPAALQADVEALNRAQVFFPLENAPQLNYYEAEKSGFAVQTFELNPFYLDRYGQRAEASYPSSGEEERPTPLETKLQELIGSPQAEADIAAYLEACRRYLGSAGPQVSPQEALANFREGTALYPDAYHYTLQSRMQALHEAQESGWHLGLARGHALAWALGVVMMLANPAVVLRYIGWKQTFLALLLGSFPSIFLGIFSFGIMAMVGGSAGILPGLISLGILGGAVAVIYQAGKSHRQRLSWIYPAILGIGQVYILYIGLVAIGIGMGLSLVQYATWDDDTAWWFVSIPCWVGIFLYATMLLPRFHKAYLKYAAQPPLK
jgi:hypothetical protein